MSSIPSNIHKGMKLIKAEYGNNSITVPENAEVYIKGRHIVYSIESPEEKEKNRENLEIILTKLLGREARVITSTSSN